jgi:hypothetical protein
VCVCVFTKDYITLYHFIHWTNLKWNDLSDSPRIFPQHLHWTFNKLVKIQVKSGRKQFQTVFKECSFRKTLAIQKRNARGFKKDHPLPLIFFSLMFFVLKVSKGEFLGCNAYEKGFQDCYALCFLPLPPPPPPVPFSLMFLKKQHKRWRWWV